MSNEQQPLPIKFKLNGKTLFISTEQILGGRVEYASRAADFGRKAFGEFGVLRNFYTIRRFMTKIVGTKLREAPAEIGYAIKKAKLDPDQNYYLTMQQRLNASLLPFYGFDPENAADIHDFYRLFAQACRAHDEAVFYGVNMLRPALDARAFAYTEMLQETKNAATPLELMEYVFNPNPRLSYEARRKLITALYLIPTFKHQEGINGMGDEIFDMLTRQSVISGTTLYDRTVIARVDTTTGECLTWRPFDQTVDIKLESGTTDGKEWQEMVFCLPSRKTSGDKLVMFTNRDKRYGSLTLKTLKKLETVHKDFFATRFVFDEQAEDITKQVAVFLQQIVSAFEKEGYSVTLSLDPNYFYNTLTQEFTITVNQVKITIPVAESNGHNQETHLERKIFHTDLTLTKPDSNPIDFEIQCLDTTGEINRHTSPWCDPVYKAKQFLAPLNDGRADSSLATLFFPPYYLGVDVNEYREIILAAAHRAALTDPPHLKLPDVSYMLRTNF